MTGVVSVVRNSHLADDSLHSLCRGEWPGWAGDALLRFLLPTVWKHTCLGTFRDICLQNSPKTWQKLKTPQILLVCFMEAADKEILRGFATHPQVPGPYFTWCGGNWLSLGWMEAVSNELTSLTFHLALGHGGRALLGREGCPELGECPARNCLSLHTRRPQCEVAALVFIGIQNTWRGGKEWKFCWRWGGWEPAVQQGAAALQAQSKCPSTRRLVWNPTSLHLRVSWCHSSW